MCKAKYSNLHMQSSVHFCLHGKRCISFLYLQMSVHDFSRSRRGVHGFRGSRRGVHGFLRSHCSHWSGSRKCTSPTATKTIPDEETGELKIDIAGVSITVCSMQIPLRSGSNKRNKYTPYRSHSGEICWSPK
jgi:hypothetical protein